MQILHLSSEFPPQQVYGLGRYVHELSSMQALLGHDVEVVTNSLSGRDAETEVSGVHVRRVHFPPPPKAPATSSMLLHFNLQLLERVLEVRNARYGVVNAHDWLTMPAAFHCARLLKIPLVTTLHDIIFSKTRRHDLTAEDLYIAGIENWATHVSATTIVLSEAVKQETLFHYHADPTKVKVVPGGVGIAPADESCLSRIRAWRSKLAPKQEDLLLYVGRLDPEKGLDAMLKAADLLKRTQVRHPWKLAIAGSGQLNTAIEEYIQRQQLSEYVALLGYVPQDELRMAYAAADVVLVPSDYEPFGLVALEAQRMGTPVIVSRTGGLIEIIEKTKGGLFFTPGNPEELMDAIQKLLSNKALRDQLGTCGQANAQKYFGWEVLARAIDDVYQGVLESGPPPNLVPPEWTPLSTAKSGSNVSQVTQPTAVSALPETPAAISVDSKKPCGPVDNLTVFWSTDNTTQLNELLKILCDNHALKSLNGVVNVVLAIAPGSNKAIPTRSFSHKRVRYLEIDQQPAILESMYQSAALVVEGRLAASLVNLQLVLPHLIPTLWIGEAPHPRFGGRTILNAEEFYAVVTKLLCDDKFRAATAPTLFNGIPRINWPIPERKVPLIMHVLPQLVTGGAETVLLDLVKAMSPDFNHEILCLGPLDGALPSEFEQASVAIHRVSSEDPDPAVTTLLNAKPDLLHLHSMSYVPTWLKIHRHLTDIPIIETEHVVNIGSGHFGPVNTVVCVSNATRAPHKRHIPTWNGVGSEFEVIYNGLNLTDYANLPSKAEAKRRLQLPLDRPIVGRVSALARNKLPEEALRVIPLILKRLPNALFVIVGDGPERNGAENWVNAHGLQDSVQFLGERRDIPEVLRAFDVFAYYTTRDALGNVILEAVAAGVPAVVTDTEGTSEALGAAPGTAVKLGDFDRFADAVAWWATKGQTIDSTGYQLPTEFSRTRMVEKYRHLYKRVLPETSPPRDRYPINSSSEPVTILLPVFNVQRRWLAECLESIKSQHYSNWNLLIVDDASTSELANWLSDYVRHDPALAAKTEILRMDSNKGVAKALNLGLNHCKTELVARMDADDRMLPDRLSLQVAAFSQMPKLSVIGGWADLMDENGERTGGRYVYPSGHAQIVEMLKSSCAFAHPSVMYRKSAVLGLKGYFAECRHFEDYDLWIRMARAGHQFFNLPTPILQYRIHANSVSRIHEQEQSRGAAACAHLAETVLGGRRRKTRPRVLFTGVHHSYGSPGRGLSVEQFFFGRAMEQMPEIELHRFPADVSISQLGPEAAGETLIKTAKEIRADMVFTVLGNPELDFLGKHIRTLTDSGILTLNWNCDDHWRIRQTSVWAEYYSHMVTTDSEAVPVLERVLGKQNVLLSQWACNPTDYFPGREPRDIDVSFIGQPYGNRPKMLNALKQAGVRIEVHGAGWRDGKEIDFALMLGILRRSKIVLNFSRATQGERRQIKARFFEIPACGAFMLTEYAPGMEAYLKPGTHFDTFETEKELVEKTFRWMKCVEREQWALEASSIVRSSHTYASRLQQVFLAAGLFDRN